MKPKDAAKVFDSMMPDQEDLVVRILENLTSDQRAAILSRMSVANAAILTEKMQQLFWKSLSGIRTHTLSEYWKNWQDSDRYRQK